MFLNYTEDMANSDAVSTPTLNAVLDALSDRTRRQIVHRLSLEPRLCNSFGDLGSKTKLSYHYAVLHRAGLTRTERQGVWKLMFLRLSEMEAAFPGLLTAVLEGAAQEEPVRDTGRAPAGFPMEEACRLPAARKPRARKSAAKSSV